MECIGHNLSPDFPAIPPNVPGASKYDGTIVIIGAGVAGLSAAATLRRMGMNKDNIIILEASDRIGGRLKATPPDTFLGAPNNSNGGGGPPPALDLGAEWIHSAKGEKVLQDIMQDLPGDGDGGAVVPELIPYKPKIYLNNRRSYISTWLYKETKFFDTTWYHWMMTNLYAQVKDCVVLNSPVTNVKYVNYEDDMATVTLTLQDGTTRTADRLICTAPLAVLQERQIVFDPPLPKKLCHAIDTIPMPPGVRVLFQMKRKFYKDLNILESMRGTVNDSDDMAAIYDPLLGKGLGEEHNVCAFVAIGDKNAGDLCQLSDDELANAVLARIDQAYDGQGTQNLMGTPIVQNWKAEPYIRGAYTFSCPSRLRKELVKPIGNKSAAVFLAGEHTSPKHYSLVPGAACEGRRAAFDIVSSLNLGGK